MSRLRYVYEGSEFGVFGPLQLLSLTEEVGGVSGYLACPPIKDTLSEAVKTT